MRLLRTVACALLLYRSSSASQDLLEHLTLRIEMPADAFNLELGSLPIDLQQDIYSGGVDLRQQILYDAPSRQLSVRTFIVPPGSLQPTSLLVVQNNEVEGFRADITSISLDDPSRTLILDGFVASGNQSSVHGAVPGEAFRLTARYNAGVVQSFDQVRLNTGSKGMLSFRGSGALIVENVANRAPVAEAGPAVVAFMTEVLLDGLRSYDQDGEELDYKWHVIAGAATLRGCETPAPILQLVQGRGSYEVRLTVTDSRGASSYDYIRINYVGR